MTDLLRGQGRIAQALWWGTLADLSVLHERIVDHGRRYAYKRLAHLLYEMLVRYRVVGLTKGATLDFPITQVDLADATGLTLMHVSRMFRKLRDENLIRLKSKTLTILDPERLREVAGFNPTTCILTGLRTSGTASLIAQAIWFEGSAGTVAGKEKPAFPWSKPYLSCLLSALFGTVQYRHSPSGVRRTYAHAPTKA